MIINFDTKMKTFAGEIFIDGNTKEEVKLKDVCILAISAQPKDEIPTDTKAILFNIGIKIANGGEVELTNKELLELENITGKILNTLLYGQISALLNGKDPFKDDNIKKE